VNQLLNKLLSRNDLDTAEASELAAAMISRSMSDAMTGALLAALRSKGETAIEATAFAREMLARANPPALNGTAAAVAGGCGLPVIDIVGTGGDGSSSLNISTAAAILTAAVAFDGQSSPRAIVLKHGARAVSSRCGTADVLAALGLAVPTPPDRLASCVNASGFGFLFAPSYHPALAALAPLRRELGVRTIFNLVGPLASPARPTHALFGAYSLGAARVMATSAMALGMTRCLVVHADNGWDEATPAAALTVVDAWQGQVARELRLAHGDFGLPPCDAAALVGGDADFNARALRTMLSPGAEHSAMLTAFRDATLMNSALALLAAGLADDLATGIATGRRALEGGAALATLDRAIAATNAPVRIFAKGAA